MQKLILKIEHIIKNSKPTYGYYKRVIKLIVQIGIDRIDEIVEFENLCFSSEAWSREQIIDVLNDKRTIYLCYEENGKIIGLICLYNWCSEKDFS